MSIALIAPVNTRPPSKYCGGAASGHAQLPVRLASVLLCRGSYRLVGACADLTPVHLLPASPDRHRIRADQELPVVLDRPDHGELPAEQSGLAPAMQPALRLDLHLYSRRRYCHLLTPPLHPCCRNSHGPELKA